MKPAWFVYIVQCADRSFYTGIARDVLKRNVEHNSPHGGAKYTRARQPVSLVYSESHTSRSSALKREHQIKRMSRLGKKALIATWVPRETAAI